MTIIPNSFCIFCVSFSEDIYFMTGRKPNIFWKACWMVISPLMLLVVFIAYVVVQAQTHPTYPAWNPDYVSKQKGNLSTLKTLNLGIIP